MKKILPYKKSIAIIILVLIVVFTVDFFVSKIIKNKISDLIIKNKSEYYTASVDAVNFKLFESSLTINGINLIPKSTSIQEVKNQEIDSITLHKVSLTSVKLDGIHLFKMLFNNKVEVNKLTVSDLLIQDFKSKNKIKKEVKPLNLDSIYIEKLKGLTIDQIKFENFIYQNIELPSNKITFQNQPLNFDVGGFKLKGIGGSYFKIEPVNNEIEIKDIHFDFPKKHYTFSIEKFLANFKNKKISIENLQYKPSITREELANKQRFNVAIFDIDVGKLDLYNYDFSKTINQQGVFIDSIYLEKVNCKIYKDKRKPFDKKKYIELPHVALKHLKTPVLVKKVRIGDSKLLFESVMDEKGLLMKISLNHIRAEVDNITSVKKQREKPLNVNFNAQFVDKADLHVDLSLSLKDKNDLFYYSGSLGASKFIYYDNIIFPALGMKILNGEIDKINFSAVANNQESSGKMTMLYHGLETQVFKQKDVYDDNEFLSWAVNTVLHKSNPIKNKETREVVMYSSRVTYKGVVAYIWKTLQNGIVNTIAPTGKTIKKVEAKEHRKSNKKHHIFHHKNKK